MKDKKSKTSESMKLELAEAKATIKLLQSKISNLEKHAEYRSLWDATFVDVAFLQQIMLGARFQHKLTTSYANEIVSFEAYILSNGDRLVITIKPGNKIGYCYQQRKR